MKYSKNLHPYKTIKHYTTWHNCSKGYMKVVDENSKSHYPNHAEASANLWLSLFPDHVNEARLMLHDMDFHTLKVEQILEQELSIEDLCTLMVVALAELHSNASLFGGIESESFKIKFKKLEKIGMKVCKKLFVQKHVRV